MQVTQVFLYLDETGSKTTREVQEIDISNCFKINGEDIGIFSKLKEVLVFFYVYIR